jgi:phosphoketolase
MKNTLSKEELELIDAYWRATNYLSVGQIYLYDNPLLKEPLKLEHIKPRLLGHWGTTPGLNFMYVHLNRMIKAQDLDMIFICGPGHGGPAVVANTYLEGTYSELYPNISQDAEAMPMGPPSIIPTSSSPVSLVTARPKLVPSPLPGTRTSSSTRSMMGPSFPSCT